MNNKQMQAAVKKVVDNFDVDGSSDYSRMDQQITAALGQRLDNKSLWALVNKATGSVERVSFTLED